MERPLQARRRRGRAPVRRVVTETTYTIRILGRFLALLSLAITNLSIDLYEKLLHAIHGRHREPTLPSITSEKLLQ